MDTPADVAQDGGRTPHTTPVVARTRAELAAARAALPARVGAVLTMGALHEGHGALIREARRSCDAVVVTIFLNPLQFGPSEDLARYPRWMPRRPGLGESDAGPSAVTEGDGRR